MKNLILTIAILFISVSAFADAPYAGQQRQKEFFKLKQEHQIQILNYDHEMANLENQVYDLQAFNKELMAENAKKIL